MSDNTRIDNNEFEYAGRVLETMSENKDLRDLVIVAGTDMQR